MKDCQKTYFSGKVGTIGGLSPFREEEPSLEPEKTPARQEAFGITSDLMPGFFHSECYRDFATVILWGDGMTRKSLTRKMSREFSRYFSASVNLNATCAI